MEKDNNEKKIQRQKKILNQRKDLEEPLIRKDEQARTTHRENLARRSRRGRRNLQNHIKFANKHAPQPIVPQLPVVYENRALYNEDSAITHKPARIIPAPKPPRGISNRMMRDGKKYLSKNNFPQVTIHEGAEQQKEKDDNIIIPRQVYKSLMHQILKNIKCYHCESNMVSYVIDEMTHWASIACRNSACYGETKYHVQYGSMSIGGWLAITQKRENQCDEEVNMQNEEAEELQGFIQVVNKRKRKEEKIEPLTEKLNSVISTMKVKREIENFKGEIKLIPNKPKIPQLMKLTFAERSKVSSIGMRSVNTIPVTQSLSYKKALLTPAPPRQEIVHTPCDAHTLTEVRTMYKKLLYKLRYQWKSNLKSNSKPYFNPFLDNTNDYVIRFSKESNEQVWQALTEWFECAKLFGDPSRIDKYWYRYNITYK